MQALGTPVFWLASVIGGLSLCVPVLGLRGAEPKRADEILAAAGVQGGIVVHVGCGDGRLTAALHAGDSFLVHGLDTDPKNVEAARQHVQSLGLYGPVSIAQWDGQRLPYIENFVS
jgi:ubiquinone/menaquinone biosynthesis C-methylase UbiE